MASSDVKIKFILDDGAFDQFVKVSCGTTSCIFNLKGFCSLKWISIAFGRCISFEEGISNMSEIEKAYRQIDKLQAQVDELRRQRFARFSNEECWVYLGDGTDHLESLVCPVVIDPKKLMEILEKARRSQNGKETHPNT